MPSEPNSKPFAIASISASPRDLTAISYLRLCPSPNLRTELSEVTKKLSEYSKMTTAEFAQYAMQTRLAPRSLGSVKERICHAQRELGRRKWSRNRVRDLWYMDARASAPKWEEVTDLEELTGLEYARQEVRTNDAIISAADALLMGSDPDFVGAFVAALRSMVGLRNRPGTPGGDE
jgi:hypothetical protein